MVGARVKKLWKKHGQLATQSPSHDVKVLVLKKKESMVSSLLTGAMSEFQIEGAIFNFSLDLWVQILSMYS